MTDDETKQDMTLSEYWVPPNVTEISLVEYPAETRHLHNLYDGEITSEITSVYHTDKITVPSETYYRSVSSMVKEFMLDKPGTDLWIDLIWEEAQELFEIYDVYVNCDRDVKNGAALLKEMADLVYVVHGLANEMNWDLDEAIQRVHKSNMSKLDDNGQPIYREDGKRMKSKNYKPPYLGDLVQ